MFLGASRLLAAAPRPYNEAMSLRRPLLAVSHLGLALFVALSASAAPDEGDDESRFESLAAALHEAEKAEDYPRVTELYAEMTRLQPGNPYLHRGLGLSYYLQREYSKAIAPLEKAASLGETVPGARLYLGISYYRTNRFEEAAAVIQKAPEIATAEQLSHYWLGAAQRAMGRYPEAIASLAREKVVNPTNLEVLSLLARVYAEYSARLQEELLSRAPNSAYGLLLRAKDEAREGAVAAAIELASQALAEDPLLVEAQLLKAEMLRAQGRPTTESAASLEHGYEAIQKGRTEEAARRLAASLAAAPGSAAISYELAETYDNLSRQTAEALFELYPDSHRVRMLRGEAYEQSSRLEFDAALAEYRAAEQLQPDELGVHAAIGRVLWRLNRFDEAIVELEKELKLNPSHGTASFLLGRIFLDRGQVGEAIARLTTAAEAQPQSLEIGRTLARALVENGRPQEGIEIYQALMRDYPDEPSIHALLAYAFRKAGRMEAAKRSADKARELGAARALPGK